MQEWDPDAGEELTNMLDQAIDESFPASDPPAEDHDGESGKPRSAGLTAVAEERKTSDCVTVQLDDGQTVELDHGMVVIAAITSCTNTSNPSVMIGAGLLAKKAVERGLARKPWVKTSLAPGSTVVTEYLEKAGLDKYLDQLQFNLVGYGCTTCIGNSGPLPEAISEAVNDNDLVVCSVLSGNRNFEGRINPDTRANYLASPPLVVAYALAGRMDIDLTSEPARPGLRRPARLPLGHLAELRGDQAGRGRGGPRGHVHQELRRRLHRRRALARDRGPRGRPLHVARLDLRAQAAASSRAWTAEPKPVEPIEGARVLAVLGDSVTTDHISPAGAIKKDSPAGRWLIEQGVEVRDFNSYGSRRGNHEVMIRGTFANVRLRNRLRRARGRLHPALPRAARRRRSTRPR